MNDIDSLTKFLNSLSRITPYRIAFWGAGVNHPPGGGMDQVEDIKTFTRRVMQEPGFRQIALNEDKAVYGVPVRSDEKIIGALTACGPNGSKHTDDIRTFLNRAAGLIQDRFSYQRETEALTHELARSFEDLNLYARIARQVKALKFSADRLKDILQEIFETMRVDLVFSRLFNHPEYTIHIGRPDLTDKIPHPEVFIGSLIGNIPLPDMSSPIPYFIVNDAATAPDYRRLHPDTYRFLAVPMCHNNDLLGWLGMLSSNMDEIFRQSELNLLSSMAEQITVVIANSELYMEMERFVINVVKSLVHAIEAKDYYTRGHSERVNRYCMAMADRLSMEKEERESLHWASMLHDVGKIGIPEIILNKPQSLDDEEYGLVKSHPQKGYDILKPIEQIAGSLPGILHHHERYDGKGYPKGLKGDKIPLIARIIAVADMFDALTSDRAYRDAIPPRQAVETMKKVSGRQLDPDLLELFRMVLQDMDGLKE